MGLALGGVRGGDGVDDRLRLLMTNLLVVIDDVAQVVSATVVCLAHAHTVVREVDIAVVAEDWKEEERRVSYGVHMEATGRELTFRHLDCIRWCVSPQEL